MSEFLFELLAEEIPAGVLPGARQELLEETAKALAEARIKGKFFCYSTSRRLILLTRDLPENQPDYEVEAIGPSVSVAFDKNGVATRAAVGFAKGQGVPVESLTRTTLAKGEYVVAKKIVEGKPTPDVIASILPGILQKMTFPRMMRWGDGKQCWVRPVHSIVALFDGLVVPMTIFGVDSGRSTVGHRTLGEGRIVTAGIDDYFARLRRAYVEPDQHMRRDQLAAQAESLAEEVDGTPSKDPALLDTLANLVESPGLVRGAFHSKYLELPDEILVTTMREHQKMLPIRRKDGTLSPHFLAVADHVADPKGYIVRGNEWVLSARLADARFFFDDDVKTKLEDRLGKLGALQFQEKLGDYLKKTGRIQELAERLVARLSRHELAGDVVKASRLLKTDLVTDMVREFTDLQGIVGGLYAKREGEPESVWQAIYDQYLPASADDPSPRGDVGGIVGLADRLDTLTGLFGLGLVPTGSRDPYGLRRAALGVVKILLDKRWRLDLPIACSDALLLHRGLPKKREEVLPELNAFLLERLRFLLEKRGVKNDEIESVLSTECRDVADAADRALAVHAIRQKEDFVPLAIAFKRIVNILAQAEEVAGDPEPGKMTEDAERMLAGDFFQARPMLDGLIARRRYEEALRVMASFGPTLDRFFVDVMVMAEDEGQRRNRLALLRAMRDQFFRVAKFSEIQG